MNHRNTYKETVLTAVFLLFLSALPTFANANEMFGIVNTATDPLNIRRQPNLNSAIITQVHKGAKLRILGNAKTTGWYQVQLSGGTVGYASSEYIIVLFSQDSQMSLLSDSSDPIFNETYGVVTTQKDPLNIRRQPNLNSAVIATVNKGSKLQILGNAASKGWYQVQVSNGTVGYASSEYIMVLISQGSQKSALGVTPSTTNEMYGIVNTQTDPLNIRRQPNMNSAVIATAKKGSKLRILDNSRSQDWYQIKLSNGTVGYASSKHITVLIPEEPF